MESNPKQSLKISEVWKNSQKSKKGSQKIDLYHSIKNDEHCYTMQFHCLKLKNVFKYSIYHVIKLKYEKFNLLRKNTKTNIFLICLRFDRFKTTLNMLLSGKLKVGSSCKEELKKLSLIKNKSKNSGYWSVNVTQSMKPSELILQKSKII
jgi:hypothetical protein